MTTLLIAIGLTLTISAFCSLLEAMILSTTTAEIEGLKNTYRRRGELLESFREDIEETSSAVLSLNTIANTLGSVLIGGLATKLYGEDNLIYFSIGMTLGILIFSEILPKNAGVFYRLSLQKHLVYPLAVVCALMQPFSWFFKHAIRFFLKDKASEQEDSEQEIILLAEKSAKEGTLTTDERDIISNALSLDDVRVSEMMTPRTVVAALDRSKTIQEVFEEMPNIPFARLPVYDETIDKVVGFVRRKDLLNAKAKDKDSLIIETLAEKAPFIPETVTAADALQQLLKAHQQFAVVVDEFGSVAGVLTMEDIMEHILGKEIFEKGDIAVDMREFARLKKKRAQKQQRRSFPPFKKKKDV
tara:strand:+ start:42752 stop:43825 length:1074 start_codon:yes stop_codon:yes gene_type:complete